MAAAPPEEEASAEDSAEAAAGSCADLVLPSRALSALVAVQRRFRERLAKRKQHELRARSKSLRNLELVGLRNRISQDDELSNLKQQQADAPETTASPWLLDSSSGSSGPDLIAPANFNQWRDIRPTVKGAKTGLARILHCQLHPFEPARLTWDLLMLLAVTYAVFWGTYVAVFEGTDSFQTWYGTIVEVLFWVDILLNFVTGFVNRECMVSFGRAAVARHYVFGWFVVDIVATVQWRDLALLIAGDDGDGSSGAVSDPLQRLLQLCGVLRLSRAPRLISRLVQESTLGIHSEIISFLRFSYYAGSIAHLLACLFFLLPALFTEDCAAPLVGTSNANRSTVDIPPHFACTPADSWREANMLHHNFEGGDAPQYFMALYWSITTMTSIGYGDITPVSSEEVKFVVVAQLVGLCFFGLLVDRITRLSSVLEDREDVARVDDVASFLRRNNVDKAFRSRVISFMHFASTSEHSKSFADDDARFATLSPALRRELRCQIFVPVLRRVSVLQDERLVPGRFVDALAQQLRSGPYCPGEQIIVPGEYGHELCIVITGQVVLRRDGVSRDLIMANSRLNCFGMTAALLDHNMYEQARARTANWSSNAVSYCDIARIEHDSFVQALALTWPDGEPAMRKSGHAEVLRVEGRDLKNCLGDAQGATLWIGGIPERYATTERVTQLMRPFGSVAAVTVRPKAGFKSWALVTFCSEESSKAALAAGKVEVTGEVIQDGEKVRPAMLKIRTAELENALGREKTGKIATIVRDHGVMALSRMDSTDGQQQDTMEEKQSMATVLVNDMLSRSFVFKDLPHANREAMAAVLPKVHFEPNNPIVQQGVVGESMWILASGEATEVVDGGVFVRRYKPGEHFGAMALLTPGQTAESSVVAATACICLSFDRASFDKLTEENPELPMIIRKCEMLRMRKTRLAAQRPSDESNSSLQLMPSNGNGVADSTSKQTSSLGKPYDNQLMTGQSRKLDAEASEANVASELVNSIDQLRLAMCTQMQQVELRLGQLESKLGQDVSSDGFQTDTEPNLSIGFARSRLRLRREQLAQSQSPDQFRRPTANGQSVEQTVSINL